MAGNDASHTPGLRIVLQRAAQIAERARHPEIAPEHLLLAILSRGAGMAHQLFADLGVDVAVLQAQLRDALKPAQCEEGVKPAPCETAKTILRDAQTIGRAAGCDWVSTDHLLLALLGANGTLPSRILADMGVTLEKANKVAAAYYEKSFPDSTELKRLLKEQGIDWDDPTTLDDQCGFGELAPGQRPEDSERR